jgi:hypothetical protein
MVLLPISWEKGVKLARVQRAKGIFFLFWTAIKLYIADSARVMILTRYLSEIDNLYGSFFYVLLSSRLKKDLIIAANYRGVILGSMQTTIIVFAFFCIISTLFIIGLLVQRLRRSHPKEALCKSEERYLFALESSTNGLRDWDILSDTVLYSDHFRETPSCSDMKKALSTMHIQDSWSDLKLPTAPLFFWTRLLRIPKI